MKRCAVWGLFAFLAGCASAAGLISRSQDPKNRPYRIETVLFAGGDTNVELAGELTMPRGGGPFKAVILITGSGPQDRNEAIAGHKPFLVLSDYLTRKGFAVLRYDDRGIGKSTGDFAAAALPDFAADAVAAFEWLSTRPEIDTANIGFLGHSEGGYIAPVAAGRVPAGFMIFLAGTAKRLLPDVIETQTSDILRSQNQPQATIFRAVSQVRALTRILKAAKSATEAKNQLARYLESEGFTPSQIRTNLDLWATNWGMGYADYDPLPALKSFNGPVLALFGSTDLQVSARENAPETTTALQNSQSEVVIFPGLNHLFQPSKTGRIEDYLTIKITIDPSVLSKISGWLKGL